MCKITYLCPCAVLTVCGKTCATTNSTRCCMSSVLVVGYVCSVVCLRSNVLTYRTCLLMYVSVCYPSRLTKVMSYLSVCLCLTTLLTYVNVSCLRNSYCSVNVLCACSVVAAEELVVLSIEIISKVIVRTKEHYVRCSVKAIGRTIILKVVVLLCSFSTNSKVSTRRPKE